MNEQRYNSNSEAHRKLKQENFIDFEQELYDDHDDKLIKDFEKQFRNSKQTFNEDKNNKQNAKEKDDNARKDTNATSHQDFQSNILTKKLEDNKGDHAEEETKADPESHFKLSSESYNNFDNLQYGSQIMLNIEDEVNNLFRKLTTKLRISEKCLADVMEESEYNINCLFKVLPSAQFNMQDKILTYIEEDQIPMNIDVEFENFSSEVISNSTIK